MLAALLALVALAAADYTEHLTLKPLARNTVLASFEFSAELPQFPLEYNSSVVPAAPRHYGRFPRALAPILQATNTRELHLRFTQGWWDAETWGKLPMDGTVTGGTGVEIWAAVEAQTAFEAQVNWLKLTESLSGFFCALLNFVDELITTFPQYRENTSSFVTDSKNSLFLMRAALPDEPICTENLTPFLKMLPTRGKAGIASLLDGHKLYDSLWHSMSIDVLTNCDEGDCKLQLNQNIHQIVDIMRLVRRRNEGGIPKPTPGDKLRCDPNKYHDQWYCFPLGDETEFEWDLAAIFGKPIRGAGFEDEPVSLVLVDVDPEYWKVVVSKDYPDSTVLHEMSGTYNLLEAVPYNFRFETLDSRHVAPVEEPPVFVSRSLTGYSQDQGGMRVTFQNHASDPVTLVYSETLPWFMRVYLHTLKQSGEGSINEHFYKPAIDRKRPGHLELQITVPAEQSFTLTYQFDKSLLLYSEYPPDANHGFAVEPAVVKVVEGNSTVYQMRTASLLLTLPTPDFSMPYNVIILTCTLMSLAFGTIFNLLTKKVVTEEEFENASSMGPVAKLKAKIAALKSKASGKKVAAEKKSL